MTSRLDALLAAQRALRSRFDDFRHALKHDNRPAIEVALVDFERHLRRWTETEEKALVPALLRGLLAVWLASTRVYSVELFMQGKVRVPSLSAGVPVFGRSDVNLVPQLSMPVLTGPV